MSTRTEIRWKQLQRAGWMLWAAAFALLIALATVVPALYARVLGLAGRENAIATRSPIGMPKPIDSFA